MNMPVAMNGFLSEPKELKLSMKSAADRVIDSGWYVLGNECAAFEQIWAARCGVKYAVGVGNGMDAIEIILRSLNIGPGDEVITTPMTAFATVLAILRSGASPVLADIDAATAHISLNSAKRCINKNTRAIIYVHLYGQIGAMDIWHQFCIQQNIFLIEDCAQSHLAQYRGGIAGSFGVAGAYSFYPTKNLGALGDAGMIVTNSDSLFEQARKMRNYGQSIRYHHPVVGMNSRLDEMQAAILIERSKWLDVFTERRRQIAGRYTNEINNLKIQLLPPPPDRVSHVYHLYVIKCLERGSLIEYLSQNAIDSLIHYPIPVHEQVPCKDILRDSSGLQISEEHANFCLSIPCHPQMTEDEVSRVVSVINKFN
jgi:dTDP-4-amino-4,6-dideoxygalactose transaminase